MDPDDLDLCLVDMLSTSVLLHPLFSDSSPLESSHMPPSFSRHTFPLVNQIIPGCISKEIFNPRVCACDWCTAAGILKQALGSWKKLKLDRHKEKWLQRGSFTWIFILKPGTDAENYQWLFSWFSWPFLFTLQSSWDKHKCVSVKACFILHLQAFMYMWV